VKQNLAKVAATVVLRGNRNGNGTQR